MRRSSAKNRWFGRTCRVIFLAAVMMWLGGFFWYVQSLQKSPPQPREVTQGIVVLTGGPNRIKAAVALLEAGLGERLLISGVNQAVAPEELRRLLDISTTTYACCIDLGKSALNTEDNALEAAMWAAAHDYHSLGVVTSLDHMPRSMVEFRRVMPGLRLVAHPIRTAAGVVDETSLPKMALEYSKYVVSLLRARLMSPPMTIRKVSTGLLVKRSVV